MADTGRRGRARGRRGGPARGSAREPSPVREFPEGKGVDELDLGEDFIAIDGSLMEGGGQVVRNSTSFSAIFRRPIHITDVRQGRAKGGLKAQHLTGINLVASMCGAEVAGNSLGSRELKFRPGPIVAGEYLADIQTAGSLCLLMQVALPPLLFAPGPSRVVMRGGTNAENAPQIDYFLQVFLPTARRFGADCRIQLNRRGFFPRGGGEVVMEVDPIAALQPVTALDRGELRSIHIRAFTAGTVPPAVAGRMVAAAAKVIKWYLKEVPGETVVAPTTECVHESPDAAVGDGTGIMIVVETTTGERLAGSALGAIGVTAEKVGHAAGQEIVDALKSRGCMDCYLQDQVIILMALADGVSTIRVGELTLHTQTAIHFAQLITGARFSVEQDVVRGIATNIITCHGVGFRAPR